MQLLNSHVLSTLIFLPLIGAVLTYFSTNLKTAKMVSMITTGISFLLAAHVWFWFDGSTSALQFVEAYEWIPSLGIKYIVGVDGISLLLLVLTTFLMPLMLLSQWHVDDSRQKNFLALLLLLESGMIGALVAMDLVFFYVFWEAMLIPMYFIIGVWGGKRRIYAATKFVLYTVIGSLLMLAAAIVLYYIHFTQTGIYSTSLLDLYAIKAPVNAQLWLFMVFAVAFAIKVPMWPFHTWLPDAHVEAPTVGSVILAGVLLKMGTYGLLRFAIPLFPDAIQTCAPLFVFCGVVGIIYGALTAWVQTDAKKMVAYSSVSHLGFVVVGCFAVMSSGELNQEALYGAVYQMINHGISTGALFFLVGVIYERRHTRLLADFGGLAKNMPWFATILIVATLSSVGLPGTGGFVGEFLILLGTFQAMPVAAVFASLGVLLGAVYMLTLCRKILFGPLDNPENKVLEDLSPREFGYLVPLAVLAIVMGVFPNLFMSKLKPSVQFLAKNYREYRLEYRLGSESAFESSSKLDSNKLNVSVK
ncbi:MAG: NADH-quinone oxidoreductase subunit M [Proteobacteria bacterium]|nr:NADH-quinone oxidoreductase subunit M [Pseudomonadota bacterium]